MDRVFLRLDSVVTCCRPSDFLVVSGLSIEKIQRTFQGSILKSRSRGGICSEFSFWLHWLRQTLVLDIFVSLTHLCQSRNNLETSSANSIVPTGVSFQFYHKQRKVTIVQQSKEGCSKKQLADAEARKIPQDVLRLRFSRSILSITFFVWQCVLNHHVLRVNNYVLESTL